MAAVIVEAAPLAAPEESEEASLQMASEDLPSSPAPSSSTASSAVSAEVPSGSPPPPRIAPEDPHSGSNAVFALTVKMNNGFILASKLINEDYECEDLAMGKSFFRALQGSVQHFFLSAAISSKRQKLYARMKCGRMSNACELQCEFDAPAGIARVTGYALKSAYAPSAGPLAPFAFITKHSPSCSLTHIDLTCIPYLGHLPTDLIGRSLLSFVYAPDVHIIRQAHVDLHASRGRVVRSSASIRFVAFNGALVRAETEWSAYVNPWSRKIELVVARHRLLDAPIGDANVLAAPAEGFVSPVLPAPFVRMVENELREIMAKPVPHGGPHHGGRGVGPAVDTVTPTATPPPAATHPALLAQAVRPHLLPLMAATGFPAKDLAGYIDRLVENFVVNGTAAVAQAAAAAIIAPPPAPVKIEASSSPVTTPTTSGRDLVSIGQDLPLPLSYNQINCLENVHRLLKSQSRAEEEAAAEAEGRPIVRHHVEIKDLGKAAPLTRDTLMEHTRRLEAEYRATWSKRLSGALASGFKRPLSLDQNPTTSAYCAPEIAPPPAKQARPASSGAAPWGGAYHPQQLPTTANYIITSTPLPPHSPPGPSASTPAPVAMQRRSGFAAPMRMDTAKSFGPLSIATYEQPASVIKATFPMPNSAASLLVEAAAQQQAAANRQ